MNGALIKTYSNVVNEINIDEIPSGMYLMNISINEVNEIHKVVKVE